MLRLLAEVAGAKVTSAEVKLVAKDTEALG